MPKSASARACRPRARVLPAVLDAQLFAAGNHSIRPDEGRGEAMTGHDVMTRLSSAFVRDLVINGLSPGSAEPN